MDMMQEDKDIEEIDNNDDMDEEEADLDITDDQNQNEGTEKHPKKRPYEMKPREKKSVIWDFMKKIKVGGVTKLQFNFCKKDYVLSSTGATSHHLRHIRKCRLKFSGGKTGKHQQVLAFSEDAGNGSVTNFTYDHARVRELASHMLLVHEYSFSMFDHVVFNKFCKAISPLYRKITRQVVKEDCWTTVNIERSKLKSVLKGVSRVSITTDLWKSGQKIQYMVVTGHYVDSNWELQKIVLNFCNVPPPHTGVIISDALHRCFTEWGIENKVCSITVDNASYNDVCIRRLKEDFALRKKLSLDGKIFHVRCCAHILNLLVQDGLEQIEGVIDSVRDGIKFLKASESRLKEFAKIRFSLNIKSRKLILDCPTRWNSTYLMLASALEFKVAFSRYQEVESGFKYVPNDDEWTKVEEVCKFLGVFYEITNLISGSYYPPSNLFLVELYRLKELLNEILTGGVGSIKAMAVEMEKKFEKYWGECNVVLSLAAILDPRYKFVLIDHAFPVLYGEKSAICINQIKNDLRSLFNEYAESAVTSEGDMPSSVTVKRQHMQDSGTSSLGAAKRVGVLTGREKFQMSLAESETIQPPKYDLDTYLAESRYGCSADVDFDVLDWWKLEKWRFPILSQMAADILSIPVTTIASESTFSAGGRVIDDRRASLSVDTVQMFMQGNDWVRRLHGLKNKTRATEADLLKASNIEEVMLPEIDE